MKRICILTSSFSLNDNDNAWAWVFVRDFVKLLSDKKDIEVDVITHNKPWKKQWISWVNLFYYKRFWNSKSLTHIKLYNPLSWIKLFSLIVSGIYTLVKKYRIRKYDHSICFRILPSWIYGLLWKKIFWVEYSTWALWSDVWKVWSYPFWKLIFKSILKNAKKSYADGYWLSEWVEEISWVKTGFLPSSRILKFEDNQKVRRDKNMLLYIWRYHQNKWPDILVRAFKKILWKYWDMKLVMFWWWPLKEHLQEYIIKNNLQKHITYNWFSTQKDNEFYFKKAWLLVIPSRIESIPVILSDWAQTWMPIVATNAWDMWLLLEKVWLEEYVANTSDVDSLYDKIELYINKKYPNWSIEKLWKLIDLKISVNSYYNLIMHNDKKN